MPLANRLLVFVLLLSPVFIKPQTLGVTVEQPKIVSPGREIHFVNYSSENGLGGSNVFRTYEDSRGYLWVPCNEGISRFDGVNFVNFGVKDGLPSSAVTSACEDKKGRIWIGTAKGLAILKNNKFYKVDSSLKLPPGTIMNLIRAKDGTFWCAGVDGVFHFDPLNAAKPLIKKYLIREKVKNSAFRNIWINRKGDVLAGSEAGCFIVKNDELVRYNSAERQIYCQVEFEDGTEWFSGWNQPISVFKNGRLQKKIDLGGSALDMTRDDRGNIWIVTWDRGVFKYNGREFIHYSSREGMPSGAFWGVDKDSRGNIWFAGWGSGLYKYSGESFTGITEKYGLPSSNITSIDEADDGKIWIASDQGITCYNPENGDIKTYNEYDGKNISLIWNIYAYKSNDIWALGYVDHGYRWVDGKIIEEKDLTGFQTIKDKEGNIWIATDLKGLLKISGNKKEYIDVKAAHGSERVTGIYEDRKSNLWLLNDVKGIDLYSNGLVKNFNSSNGFLNEFAGSITQDDNGYYWLSVSGRGVFKCVLTTDERFKIVDSITVANGLISDNINSAEYVNEKLYLGTKEGLCVMDLESIEKGDKENMLYFNKEDGLMNLDCRITLVDRQGQMWLITPKGIYIYDPIHTYKNNIETNTYVTDVKLNFEKTDWLKYAASISEFGLPENLVLPHEKNHLTFSIIGINLTAPSKVLYQYKLEGLDDNWSPPSDKREVTYPVIPPGTYTFMVKSCNNDGIWNKEPSSFVFTINPPFWRTIWFYTICGIAFLLLMYAYVRYREKKLEKEKLVLENKITERTSQLQEAFNEIEEKNREITDSINYASKIQKALLPSLRDIEGLSNDSFIFFQPKDIVSGDFYWAVKHAGKVYIAVCDSTGHGVPGAFMSLLNLNFINEAINEKNIDEPNEIFNSVRSELVRSISKEGQKDGFDGVMICYDKKDDTITYSAANNKPILISNNAIVPLQYDKMPVGKGELDRSFGMFEIKYQKGDALYMFTDGYADQFGGEKGKKFKSRRLEELLLSIHHLPFEKQKQIISDTFHEWKGSLEQVDDVCVIGIRL